jgi:hypothetical protein
MKSFLSGRSHVSADSLQAPGSTSPGFTAKTVGNFQKDSHAGHGPSVECVKQGDKVTRLIVTCSCGERIEIECLYPAGG